MRAYTLITSNNAFLFNGIMFLKYESMYLSFHCFHTGHQEYPIFQQNFFMSQPLLGNLLMPPPQQPVGHQLLPPDPQPSTSHASHLLYSQPSMGPQDQLLCLVDPSHPQSPHSVLDRDEQTLTLTTGQELTESQVRTTLPGQPTQQQAQSSHESHVKAAAATNTKEATTASTYKLSDRLLKGRFYN